jgi:hypothetical protein
MEHPGTARFTREALIRAHNAVRTLRNSLMYRARKTEHVGVSGFTMNVVERKGRVMEFHPNSCTLSGTDNDSSQGQTC